MLPRNHHLIYHSLFHKASHSKLQRIQDISAKESEVIFLKREREKKKEANSPFQVANYGVQINSNGKPSTPSTPYPPKTPCSVRPGFGRVPTPAWITLWLSNTGNQGMHTSSYP